MSKLFLKAKHWQIFTIAFALPFLIQVIVTPLMVAENNPMMMLRIMPVVMLLIFAGYFGWFWSVGVGLQSMVPAGVNLNVKLFKVFFVTALVYFLVFLLFIGFGMEGLVSSGNAPDAGTIGVAMAIILPIHFFVVFCVFYILYFVAKTYKAVELQREVSFSDFAGEFFLFWFYPIGVWILQPKINRMAGE